MSENSRKWRGPPRAAPSDIRIFFKLLHATGLFRRYRESEDVKREAASRVIRNDRGNGGTHAAEIVIVDAEGDVKAGV